jgi:hypothetical protein
VLRLPSGELSKLAEVQRKEALRKKVAEPPRPLFKACRDLILRKCDPARRRKRAGFSRRNRSANWNG